MNNRIKIIVITFCIFLLALIGLLAYKNSLFRLISTDPSIKNVTVISPYIEFKFNKSLSKKISVSSNSNMISSFNIKNKSITVNLVYPMPLGKEYVLFIKNISSIDGKTLPDKTIKIKTIAASNSNITKGQRDVLLNNQSQYNNDMYNGLPVLLPFNGPNLGYRIDYNYDSNVNGGKLIIIISSNNGQEKQNAINWIKSKGFDINNYQVDYLSSANNQTGQ
ncbi:MAG: hypothetical protein WCJ05_01765 [bacterium]